MTDVLRWMLQFAAYAGFAAAIGYLSILPRYEYAAVDMTEVKVSLSHAADRVEPCVKLSPQEIAALPPNMRRTEQCERQRLPLTVELDVDGETVLHVDAPPSGLWSDGPASVYERFSVTPGTYRITARLRDSARPEGWDHMHTEQVVLEAGRYFTVTFKEEAGGFHFR